MILEILAPIIAFLLLVIGLILQVFIPGFPKETILIQAGSSFGVIIGSILNWIGMVLAAQFGYEVVRRSIETGGRYSKILDEYQNSKLVERLNQSGNYGLFYLRLIPYSPNDVLSLMAGASKLPRKGFIIVSMITAVPYAIIFAYLGSIGSEYIDKIIFLYFNVVITLISLLFVFLKNKKNKKLADL